MSIHLFLLKTDIHRSSAQRHVSRSMLPIVAVSLIQNSNLKEFYGLRRG